MTADVLTKARSALAASPIHVLRELEVEQEDESLILTGRVDSFYHKQLAQEIIRLIADGLQVINSVHVDDRQQKAL